MLDGYGYEQRDIGRKKYSNIDKIYDYVVLQIIDEYVLKYYSFI